MIKIISTLPPSFRGFMSAWDSVPVADRNINSLTSRLLKEECLTKQWNRGKLDQQDAALFSQNFPPSLWSDSKAPRGRGRGKSGQGPRRNDHSNRRSRPYRICTYQPCGLPGHTIEVCRQRIRDEKTGKASDTKAVPAVAIEEPDTSAKRENDKKDSAYISATCFLSRHADDWFADSGATGHMTDQRSFFRSFTPILHDTWTVKGIGSSRLYVRGRRSIDFLTTVNEIENTFTIEDILYVPGLGTNLLSVAAVTDVGLSVHFIETRVAISKNQTTLMVGERIGKSLYHLAIHPQLSNNNKTKYSACFAVPSPTSMALWHQRLAHTSYKTISKMANNKEVHGLNLPDNKAILIRHCPGCLSGKMHRLPFPIGRTRADQTGQLIHADVCGPMHIPTPSGARFFVLFTDDFSKSRHVYFLKHKSEVPEFFKDYTSLLRSETGNLIHTLRSDNGGEFISSTFNRLSRSHAESS